MIVHFNQTTQFSEIRDRIEQHLYDSVLEIEHEPELALKSIDAFSQAIDRLMDTLEQMYQNPDERDFAGEKSFPIREGRYRVFYKMTPKDHLSFDITFLDIDDNKQSNLDRFPTHNMITFNDGEE